MLLPSLPLLPLAPNEHLAGTRAQQRALLAQLTTLRARPRPGRMFPSLSFITLARLLDTRPAFPDPDVLEAGHALTIRRYRDLGITAPLPPSHIWVATASAEPAAFGGFHYPGQGYRHWQMIAVITRYGPLHAGPLPDPRLAALDLIRTCAHDGLHYASYRRYQLHPDGTTPVRIRYGINFRRPDGRPYSQPDAPGTTTTRDLGIIMEGATDREARAITQHTAHACSISQPPQDPDRAEYLDVTGNFTPADLLTSAPTTQDQAAARLVGFLSRMTEYERTVSARYAAFLTETSPAAPASLHSAILEAIITGSLADLCHALNQRHGPAAFTRIFRTSRYTAAQPGA